MQCICGFIEFHLFFNFVRYTSDILSYLSCLKDMLVPATSRETVSSLALRAKVLEKPGDVSIVDVHSEPIARRVVLR